MTGKSAITSILLSALLAGGGIYYAQVYAFYDQIPPADIKVELTAIDSGTPQPIAIKNPQAIDSNSSPIRYRACFETVQSAEELSQSYVAFPKAVPLVAPGWFACFDAAKIGKALETGEARAFLGQRNIEYGIDRVVAVFPDGRGYAWQQLNECGDKLYDGSPADPSCPAPDTSAKGTN